MYKYQKIPELLITQLSAEELQILLFLKSFCGGQYHTAECSAQFIATALRMSKKTVIKYLSTLKERGIIFNVNDTESKHYYKGKIMNTTSTYAIRDYSWVKAWFDKYKIDEWTNRTDTIMQPRKYFEKKSK